MTMTFVCGFPEDAIGDLSVRLPDFGIRAFADNSGSCSDNALWSLDENGKLTISGFGSVTSYPWSSYNTSIAEIKIGSDIKSLCSYAFSGCVNLTSIVVPTV